MDCRLEGARSAPSRLSVATARPMRAGRLAFARSSIHAFSHDPQRAGRLLLFDLAVHRRNDFPRLPNCGATRARKRWQHLATGYSAIGADFAQRQLEYEDRPTQCSARRFLALRASRRACPGGINPPAHPGKLLSRRSRSTCEKIYSVRLIKRSSALSSSAAIRGDCSSRRTRICVLSVWFA